MARHTSTQYTADASETFDYADAASDKFQKQDVQKLGKAVENSTHGVGRGKAVERLASGASGALPAAGVAGEVYVETDTKHFLHDDGAAWHEHVDLDTAQTISGVKTFGSLKVSGPAAVVTSRFVGMVSADGAPTTGAWSQWDWGITESGQQWMCTVAGTPGTWLQMGGAMTGDVKTTFRSTADAGWILPYGQTIDATQAAYLNFWTWLNASGNFGAGKLGSGSQAALVLKDMRGCVLAGLDTMGGSARNLVAALNALGTQTGEAAHTLVAGELAALNYTAALASNGITISDPGHHHDQTGQVGAGNIDSGQGWTFEGPAGNSLTLSTGNATTGITATVANTTVNISSNAGGGSHNNVQPTVGVNLMVKL